MPTRTGNRIGGLAACLLVGLAFGAASAAAQDPVIAAGGDIACAPTDSGYNGGAGTTGSAPRCHQKAVSDLFVGRGLAAVLPLGDLQYEKGELNLFNEVFDPTWGRVKSIIRPVPGNHEYDDPAGGAKGYYDYFNGVGEQTGPAGDRDKGYYSFNVGAWHVIALNSNCGADGVTGGCASTSPQVQWLEADLAANPRDCTLAFWHHPRFSSATQASGSVRRFWERLDAADADVVLAGHDHIYERFAPQREDTTPGARGLRQFTVGTGGKSLRPDAISDPPALNSQSVQGTTLGALFLTLRPGSYEWDFKRAAGGTYGDSGHTSCVTASKDAQDLLPGEVPGLGGSPFTPIRGTKIARPSGKLALVTRRARVRRRGRVSIKTSCKGTASVICRGTLSLRARKDRTVLGRSSLAVRAGRTRTIIIRLNRRGRRLVRGSPRLRTQLAAAYRFTGGSLQRASGNLLVFAARR